MVVGQEERDRVRRVRALVSDWTTTRHPPPELRAEAESVLRFFQVRIEEMSTEDAAIRLATVLSTVMNVMAILHNPPALQASDPVELRSTFLWIADEMSWIASVRGTMAGLSWPSDAQERIERFRAAASAWDPAGPPPPDVLDSARHCLGILQPSPESQEVNGV
jgi:hypothetical protein